MSDPSNHTRDFVNDTSDAVMEKIRQDQQWQEFHELEQAKRDVRREERLDILQ